MNAKKSFAAWVAVGLAGASSALAAAEPSWADAPLVLEEVVVTAKAPAARPIEVVVVVAELPGTRATAAREAPIEITLGVERPSIELATRRVDIEAVRPTLSL